MATKTEIVHKRSAVTGNEPTTSQLAFGELAVNTYDSKVFFKVDDGTERIVALTPSDSVTISNNDVTTNQYTATASQTDFQLARTPRTENHVLVSINGVVQSPTVYTLADNTVTLATGASLNDKVEIRVFDTTSASTNEYHDYKVFKYSITASQSTVTGSDANGQTLDYDSNFVSVYVNGARYVQGDDYTTNAAGDTITFNINVGNGDTVEVVSMAVASFYDLGVGENSTSLSGVSEQTIDTYDKAVARTAKYIIQMVNNTDVHSTEVLITHNGTTAYMTEYATLITNTSLGTVDADISGQEVRVRVTPTASTTDVKMKRILVDL